MITSSRRDVSLPVAGVYKPSCFFTQRDSRATYRARQLSLTKSTFLPSRRDSETSPTSLRCADSKVLNSWQRLTSFVLLSIAAWLLSSRFPVHVLLFAASTATTRALAQHLMVDSAFQRRQQHPDLLQYECIVHCRCPALCHIVVVLRAVV